MRRLLFVLIGFIVMVFNPVRVFALQPTEIPNPLSGIENLGALISRASIITTPVAVVGMIFSLIYGGFIKMTALGNAEKEQKSRAVWAAAFIGFLMIAFAPVIVKIFSSIIGVSTEIN